MALKASVLCNFFIVGVLSLGWTILLCLPYGWHVKFNPLYNMDIGLYKAHVQKGLIASGIGSLVNKLSPAWSQVLDELVTGGYTLPDLQQFFCGIRGIAALTSSIGDICLLFNILTISSYVMIFLVSIALLFFAAGAYFQYMYWVEKPHDYMRQYQRICYIAAPSILLVAMIQYTWCSSFLNQFPPAGHSSFSYAYGCAATLTVLSVLPVFVSEQLVGRAIGEKIQEQLTIQKRFVRDQQAQQQISDMTAQGDAQMYAAQNQLYQQAAAQNAAYAGQGYGTMGASSGMYQAPYGEYPQQYDQGAYQQYDQAAYPQYDQAGLGVQQPAAYYLAQGASYPAQGAPSAF